MRSLLGILLAATFIAPALARTVASDGIVWNLTPAQIKISCNAQLAITDREIKRILAQRGRRTFANTVLPLENVTADMSDNLTAQIFLSSVAPDKAVRDASTACGQKIDEYYTAISARSDLERAVAEAQRSNTAKTVYDRKLTEIWLTDLVRSGAALSPSRRSEYVELSNKLDDIITDYQRNLAEDTTTITVSSRQTGGIPADVLSGAEYTHNPNGTYTIKVDESTGSFLAYTTDEAARRAYYFAYNNRQAVANTALLEQAIAIRDRLAHLMGYENWASFRLVDRMAESPARVEKFLDDLDAQILPKAQDEFATLTQLKIQETHDRNAVLEPWDVSHYDYVLNKTRYAVDSNAIRQYFPVQHVIDSVLNIYHTLLGVTFAQVKNPSVWAPDVQEYSVSDTASGKLIGYTYFDLYPRPGKYDHFANFPIVPYRLTKHHSRVPLAAIVGNWPKPGVGEPALLSHDDVVTFFHEFGHNMAALLATAPYTSLTDGFKEDFVEAPSQMLENFVWQPSILKQISSNWQTGEPLPDGLIAKMIAARYVDYAYFTTRQIMLADIDMTYHTSGPQVDTTAVWASIARDVSPMGMPEGIHPQASFGHIMGGYDAGYYAYLWSKVYAQDMFTAFEQGGLENPAVGMRYRVTILQPARTYEPDVEVRNFLGRPMNPDAFYAEFGITTPSETQGN